MAVELYQDVYGSIQHYPDEGILELRWVAETADMTDADFRRWLTIYGTLSMVHQTPLLVVDVCTFRGSPDSSSTTTWRDEQIVPLYQKGGVTHFAYLLPAEASVSNEDEPVAADSEISFATRYLTSWDAIREWFGSA